MASAGAFAASSEGPQSGATPPTSAQPFSIDEEGPINWRSFVPDVYHGQKHFWSFPGKLSREDQQSGPTPKSPSQPDSIEEERPINWKSIVPDVYHDQKNIWTFPGKLVRGEDWKPTLVFAVILGGLVAADPHASPYFRNNSNFSGFNRRLSGTNTAIGTALVPAAFYALGLVRKDSYATHTALLAGESVADAEILAWVLKNATGRVRPSAVPPGGNYSDTWFETYQPPLRADGSFPSGHAIAAFSVATVFAQRYRDHRWVPWVAYGAATLVGVSRVTLQAHFPSDVFVGAAFGYLISRFIVMPGREPEP
jgi:membrane-associated phospholipid phosphatase